MNKVPQRGAALLAVIMLTSVLVALSMSLWHSVSIVAQTAIKRIEYEKQFRLTEGLLNCGIACVRAGILSEQKRTIMIPSWPPEEQVDVYQGRVTYCLSEKGGPDYAAATIKATLLKEQGALCSLQATVSGVNVYSVIDWKIIR